MFSFYAAHMPAVLQPLSSFFLCNHEPNFSRKTAIAAFHFVSLTSITTLLTSTCSSIPAQKTLVFMSGIYCINQVTAKIFAQLCEPYQDIPLIPLIGHVMHISCAVLLTKEMCSCLQLSVSFMDIKVILLCAIIASVFIKKNIANHVYG